MTDADRARRGPPTATHPEVRIVATARQRLEGLLDHGVQGPPEDPPLEAVVAAAAAHPAAESWMLDGGEATLRKDLPALIGGLADAGAPRLGLVTDGLAITGPKVAQMLADKGLTRVRVRIASARADAHDWLFGAKGAWRRAVKAVRSCVAAGLETEVELTLTRPTRPYTDEAIDVFGKLGASAVLVRRVTARGPAKVHDIQLAPRFGIMQKDVETAVQHGVRAGLVVMLEGFPACALPAVAGQYLPTDAVVWAVPKADGFAFLAPWFEPPPAERGCLTCPGPPHCAGAPSDYVARFGRTEIDSEGVTYRNPGELPPAPLEGGEAYPPVRGGRYPSTRLSYVRLAAKLPSLGGDPLVVARGAIPPKRMRFGFLGPGPIVDPLLGDHPTPPEPESSRDIRVRLVQAAQHGVEVLQLHGPGTLAHPDAAELLRETTRLQFPRIEVTGEASAMDGFTDMQLRRLRGITRVDVALFGPDAARHDAAIGVDGAFDKALGAVDRLGGLVPSIEIGSYAVLSDPGELEAYAEAWDFGDLPGDPCFRLAPGGGSLKAMAEAAAALPEGPARDAIAAVLPKALFDRPDHVVPASVGLPMWGDVPNAYRSPSGSDRFGCYTDRPSAGSAPEPGGEPGIAVGWTAD